MKNMNWILTVAVATLVGVAACAEEAATAADATATKAVATSYKSLAEARAKIEDVIADPSLMADIMKGLSPEDQKTFLADVNAAIGKLPGSNEDKTAKYLNVNRAALKGVSKGMLGTTIAVTFATVPPEALTVISERYASDLFSRDSADGVSDASFMQIASEVIGKVETATAGADDAGVRNTLAILMFARADNGKIEDIVPRLVETMPDAATRELATKEWIPAAMATGTEKSYEGMLAYADAGKAPDLNAVLNLAGPQILESMLVDITSAMVNDEGYPTTPILDQAAGSFGDLSMVELMNDTTSTGAKINNVGTVPRTTDPTKRWNPTYKRDEVNNVKEPTPEPEPKPYPYSSL